MLSLKLFSIFLLHLIASTQGYKSGAPIPTCESMVPGHGAPSQSLDSSPFKVIIPKTSLTSGTKLELTVTSKSGRDEFKGFLLEVRRIPQGDRGSGSGGGGGEDGIGVPKGKFEEGTDPKVKTLSCGGVEGNAVTHNSNEAKKSVKVRWTPDAPGRYRVHTTFVKNYDMYWVNQVEPEVIEVVEGHDHDGHHEMPLYNWDELCSKMRLNDSLPPDDSDPPYDIKMEPIKPSRDVQDYHQVDEKGLLWINISSEYNTPIVRAFLQVRKKGSKMDMAYGRFLLPDSKDFHSINCFGGKENSLLFAKPGRDHELARELNVKWEAPSEVGDFEVVGSILRDDIFWDKITKDPEMTRIKVVKMRKMKDSSGKEQGNLQGSTSGMKSKLASDVEHLIILFIFLFSILN